MTRRAFALPSAHRQQRSRLPPTPDPGTRYSRRRDSQPEGESRGLAVASSRYHPFPTGTGRPAVRLQARACQPDRSTVIIREANPDYKCPTPPGLSTHAKTRRAQRSKPDRPVGTLGVAGGVVRKTTAGVLPTPATFTILSMFGRRVESEKLRLSQSASGSSLHRAVVSPTAPGRPSSLARSAE